MTKEQAEQTLDAWGYRLLGRDPYRDYKWHVARWIDNRTASVSVGWAETLEDAITVAESDIYEGGNS